MTNAPHWMTTGQAAAWLAGHYPGWTVRTVRVCNGLRVEACRDGAPAGVCALIGTFDEVRAELDAARRGPRRVMTAPATAPVPGGTCPSADSRFGTC